MKLTAKYFFEYMLSRSTKTVDYKGNYWEKTLLKNGLAFKWEGRSGDLLCVSPQFVDCPSYQTALRLKNNLNKKKERKEFKEQELKNAKPPSPTFALECRKKVDGYRVNVNRSSLIVRKHFEFEGHVSEMFLKIELSESIVERLRLIKEESKANSLNRTRAVIELLLSLEVLEFK